MRPKRDHGPARRTAGRALAGRPRWWQLALASAVSAGLGVGVTVGARGATVADGPPTRVQPVGVASRAPAPVGTGVVAPTLKPYLDPTQLKAVPVGPAAVAAPVKKVLISPAVTTALDAGGIPTVAVAAYQHAAAAVAASDPACHLPWQLLAGIGRVESDNGQFGGAVLLANGYGTQPIYGLPLDGRNGVALIRDTDGGALDGDPNFDRAVGPMQFIPSTWASYGADGNGDGKKDPNNIFDAALGAADYLCAGGGDLANPAQETAAVLRYNDADEYAHVVIALAVSYEHGEFATVPSSGLGGSGGASTPGLPLPTATAEVPAAAKTPVPSASEAPTQTPAPQPTTPTAAVPTVTPTATPTGASTGTPTQTGTGTPTPADTGATPSGPPSWSPAPTDAPPVLAGQTADVGWAPAMRQVVVKLLNGEKPPTQPGQHKHPGPRSTDASPAGYRGRNS